MAYNVELGIGTAKAKTDLVSLQSFANRVGKDVTDVRRKALAEIRDTQRAAIRMMSGLRGMLYAFGGALDPFASAIFNIVGSTIEMLYALATAEGATILGAPAAAVHAGIALAIQLVTLPSIIAGVDEAREASSRALAAVDAIAIWSGI